MREIATVPASEPFEIDTSLHDHHGQAQGDQAPPPKTRQEKGSSAIRRQNKRIMQLLNDAEEIENMDVTGLHLHQLGGNLAGF